MKAKWIGVIWFFLMSSVSVAAFTYGAIDKIVVFGDSLSDTGNLYEYMRHQLPMSPPYHEGRFTDGVVWIEHVLAHYFPTDTQSHMVNYAFGGSSVGSEDENDDDDDLSDGAMLNLDSELNSYFLAHNDIANPSSLYVIWMGSNNYLSLPENLDDEIQFTLVGIHRAVEKLIEKGAKHIMLVGVPDLGKIPMAREFEVTTDLSYLSRQHNTKLKEDMNVFQTRYPDVQWVFYNVDELFTEALTHPAQYGFKNVTDTCYDTLAYSPSSQSVLTMVSRIKPRLRAEHACDTYLFFDPVHPSGRAHAYIAAYGIKLLDETGVHFTG